MIVRKLFFYRVDVAVVFFIFAFFTLLECRDRNLTIANYIQPKRFFCGPTSLYLVLGYWGLENIDYSALVMSSLDVKNKLTTNSNMVYTPRHYGFETYSFRGNILILEELIKNKVPVIVLQNYSEAYKMGHFRIVVGIDKKGEGVYLKDPSKKKIVKMTYRKFERLWEMSDGINQSRWAMVIVPDFIRLQMPEVTSSPITFINMGTYFYKKEKYRDAVQMYKKAYELENNNVFAMLFYSQTLLRLGEYDEAAVIVKKTIRIDPINPLAFDILGLIHYLKREYKQALMFFAKAIELNKGKKENSFIYIHYQKTFEKVKKIEGK